MKKLSLSGRAALAFVSALVILGQAHADTLTGQVVNPNGQGVPGVNLTFSNGNPVNTVTDANGFFNVTIQAGTYDVGFVPAILTLAPRELSNVSISGTRNLGVVSLAFGFAISGTVTTSGGLPIALCNIDVYDQPTGVKLYTPGDSTNALGQFQVVVPGGTMRVRVKPPVGQLLVAQDINNVAVSAPRALGTLVLPPGVQVSGTVVDAVTNLPVANVDIDVDDAISGQRIVTPGDTSNGVGQWSTVLPTGLVHISYAAPAGNNYLGLETFNVPINGPVTLPNARLTRGLVVSGTVLGPGGAPVVNADIDVDSSPGNIAVFTPNDQTDGSGRFSVVVPSGTYQVSVEPTNASTLVGARTTPLVITANTTVPTFNLATGWQVSGTITAADGSAEYSANLDVLDPVTGASVVISGDDTDSTGSYRTYVPAGTWDIYVKTRKGSLSRVERIRGVVVQSTITLNRQLTKTPITCYLDTTGIPTVFQGGSVPITFAFVNTNAVAYASNISLVLIDPNGAELPILANLPFTAQPGQFAVSVGAPLPVPPVNPALLGKRFRYELRFDDPMTGLEQDHDHFDFFIQ